MCCRFSLLFWRDNLIATLILSDKKGTFFVLSRPKQSHDIKTTAMLDSMANLLRKEIFFLPQTLTFLSYMIDNIKLQLFFFSKIKLTEDERQSLIKSSSKLKKLSDRQYF